MGVSNGAIPAAELAADLQAEALWLASGCAAANSASEPPMCPTVVTAGSGECFFGGCEGIIAAAEALKPEVWSSCCVALPLVLLSAACVHHHSMKANLSKDGTPFLIGGWGLVLQSKKRSSASRAGTRGSRRAFASGR